MILYKDQLSTTMTFTDFIEEMSSDLWYQALCALYAYDGFHSNINYDDYLIFHVDTLDNGVVIWAITKIIDQWQPVEVNDRIRKFTVDEVWEYDSYVTLSFI